jgi:DNA-binding transcriptional ArsR family regulator
MRRDVFQGIADPRRREILKLLAGKEQTLNEVAEKFDISRPAVSKHIRILGECGLVTVRQAGRERFCTAKTKKLKEVSAWLNYFDRFWDDQLASLKKHVEK